VVDLDGTLTLTDTLVESVVQAVKHRPWDILRLPLWLLQGRSVLKVRLAERTSLAVETLPYQAVLCDFLRRERAKGRWITLATAAPRCIAEAVAAHVGLFDEVIASDEAHNLKGTGKLAAIRAFVGERFVYAGDSAADLPIWQAADSAVLVGTSPRVAKAVRRHIAVEQEFPRSHAGWGVWLQALRVHQWVKNLLIFVPLLTAFAFTDTAKLLVASLAFLSFSLAASATYVLNDLWDLDHDRRHPRKRHRPLASAQITIPAGVGASAALLLVALTVASQLAPGFWSLMILYLILTSTYSGLLKQHVLLDVLMLSMLYTLRIVAGSMAIGVTTSVWLFAFSVFFFFSLALVKRCAELVSLGHTELKVLHGRDYQVSDLVVLWPMGVGAGLCAVVVFTLFVSAAETEARYATPQLLWFVALGLLYWLGRIWIKTARGAMPDDPLVYAVRDRGSRLIIVTMVAATLAAYVLSIR
jgi:4-hydroxybenzoate polyprenyltransferase